MWRRLMRRAWLLRRVSDHEAGTPRQILWLTLADAAVRQAGLWAAEARKSGQTAPADYRPDAAARALARLLAWLGPAPLARQLAACGLPGMALYRDDRRLKLPGDGALAGACLVTGLTGAGADPAFILLVSAGGVLAGSALTGWQESRAAARRRLREETAVGVATLDRDDPLPSADLARVLSEQGVPAVAADRLAAALAEDADAVLASVPATSLGLDRANAGPPARTGLLAALAHAWGMLLPLLALHFTADATAALALAIGLQALAGALAGGVSVGARRAGITLAAGAAAWLIGWGLARARFF